MTWEMLVGCLLIVIARIGDVSLGTMRTVAVVSGHRGMAWLFGLLEVIIWVYAVSAVIAHIRTEPAYAIAFAVGAATGHYVGLTLLQWIPFGDQVVRIFSRTGAAVFNDLRSRGFVVTQFQGVGRDGPVSMLFVQVRRTQTPRVVRAARKIDPACFYTIDDIRVADTATIAVPSLTPSAESLTASLVAPPVRGSSLAHPQQTVDVKLSASPEQARVDGNEPMNPALDKGNHAPLHVQVPAQRDG